MNAKMKKNEKKLKLNPGAWGTLALTLVYLFIMDLYFDYVISREVDTVIQGVATFLALYYTWWQLKLIFKQIFKKVKNDD
jgi:hypothetical protein